MTKNEILIFIYYNKNIIDAMYHIVENKQYIDDFKSHLIMIMSGKTEEVLFGLKERNELEFYCIGVIKNQWRDKTSSFSKLYRNNEVYNQYGLLNNKFIEAKNAAYIRPIDMDDDYIIINEEKEYLNKNENTDKEKLKIINELVKNQYKELLVNQFHQTLYNMYIIEGKNLRQISELTDIGQMVIWRSVKKTKEYIKNNYKE